MPFCRPWALSLKLGLNLKVVSLGLGLAAAALFAFVAFRGAGGTHGPGAPSRPATAPLHGTPTQPSRGQPTAIVARQATAGPTQESGSKLGGAPATPTPGPSSGSHGSGNPALHPRGGTNRHGNVSGNKGSTGTRPGSHSQGGSATPGAAKGVAGLRADAGAEASARASSKGPRGSGPGAGPSPTATPAPPTRIVFKGPPRNFGDLFGLGSYAAQRATANVQTPTLTKARATGVTWLREEFTANRMHSQTDGAYRWGSYDATVRRERNLGFHILGLLDYSNTFEWSNHSYMPHDHIAALSQDFASYAYAVARHYRNSIDTWQVWNEPDLHLFWRPYPDAGDYATLLNQAYTAIKRANPKAKVVLGGPSGADPHAMRFIQQVVDAGGKFDILSMQPYQPVPGPQLIGQVQALRKFHKPIWFTEMGWAGETACQNVCGSEYSQGDRLARLYLVAAYAGVDRLFWYDLRDDGQQANFEDHFGLLQHNLAPKPSYWAYKLSLFLLDGGRLLGVSHLRSQVYALEVRNHGRVFDIIWNNALSSYALNMTWKGRAAVVLDWQGHQVTKGTSTAVRMSVPQRSLWYILPPHFAPGT